MKGDVATKWYILGAVLVTVLMAPIDSSVVNMSLPSLARVFGVGTDLVGWVSMSYLLVTSSGLLSFGRLGDIFGFRRVFLIGIAIFTVGSVLCGLSSSLGVLITFRAVQAVGAGITAALAPGIITATFPSRERGRALGMQGMVVAIGLTLGPGLGGMFLDLWGWRAVFFINVPIGILALGACHRFLPEKNVLKKENFDWQGASLVFVSLALFLFSVSRGNQYEWSGPIKVAMAGALGTGVVFFWREGKTHHPMLDLSLFRLQTFGIGNGAALLHFMTQYMVVFVTPFLLQQELGFPPSKAGLIAMAFPLTSFVAAPLSGALSDRIGNHLLSSAGAFLCTLGALSFSALASDPSSFQIAWRLSLFGLGTGMFQSPNNSAIMGAVPIRCLGISGAVLATARNVGMVFGIAFASAVLVAREAVYAFANSPFPRLQAMSDVYMAAAAVSSLCFGACILVGRRKREENLSADQQG